MYLLYLDESGTHGGSPVFVLAGLAVHEHDTWHLQQRLTGAMRGRLPAGYDPLDFELHAADIKSPQRAIPGRRSASSWTQIDVGTRFDVLRAVYQAIASYRPANADSPCALFGAVVDRSYRDREQRAYEEVLHKFDEMLGRRFHANGIRERGIVIHDRRIIERDVQSWTSTWRHVAGRIGVLNNLSDVPFFADSRASRLIQASDFVTWSLWRYYGLHQADERWIRSLWPMFDNADGVMHGLIHVAPGFRQGACGCPPCASRLNVAAGGATHSAV